MRTGEPELLRRAPDGLMPGATSYLCVPLMARDRPWGAITLVTTGDNRTFGPADLDLAAELARRAATTVETARLMRSLAVSEERYRLLFEANPLPMWVYDAKTLRFLAVNEAAVRHYGYTRDGVPGHDDHGDPAARGRRGAARPTSPSAADRAPRRPARGGTARRTGR